MLAELMLFVGMLIVLYLVVTTIPVSRRVRRMRRELRNERTRAKWAEARAKLFWLVQEGKLSADSSTFRCLYSVQTFVLRRPDAYKEIAAQLMRVMEMPRRPADLERRHLSWLDEREEWPEEVHDVIGDMAVGSISLLVSHGQFARLLYWIVGLVPGFLLKKGREPFDWVAKCIRDLPGDTADKQLVMATQRMHQLQAA